jgi:hypothetical protein
MGKRIQSLDEHYLQTNSFSQMTEYGFIQPDDRIGVNRPSGVPILALSSSGFNRAVMDRAVRKDPRRVRHSDCEQGDRSLGSIKELSLWRIRHVRCDYRYSERCCNLRYRSSSDEAQILVGSGGFGSPMCEGLPVSKTQIVTGPCLLCHQDSGRTLRGALPRGIRWNSEPRRSRPCHAQHCISRAAQREIWRDTSAASASRSCPLTAH